MPDVAASRGVGPRAILGISADYHDAAAALVVDGEIVAAASEERFSRVKHDPDLPRQAAAWCLESAGLEPGDLGGVAFYSKPLSTYERILSTHARIGPRGFPTLAKAIGTWSLRKLWVEYRIERMLASIGPGRAPVTFAEHHQSHAASAFYPSPHEHAAIITFDGVGEWTTTSIGVGSGHRIAMLEQVRFPDSLGLLYSAMTAFCGFDVNDGEYKLMGLAPYGTPRFADVLREQVVQIDPHGSFQLDQRWFDYQAGARMTRRRLADLLDGPPRDRSAEVTDREADLAASVQVVLEEAVLRVAERAQRSTEATAVCLAGGVALNCVANRRLIEDGPFADVWIQPAAGDDGAAIGAALWAWHQIDEQPRRVADHGDGMRGSFLGPSFTHDEVVAWLDQNGLAYDVPVDLHAVVAAALSAGRTVGWFSGAMEFGPRALGHRSILADPRDASAVARINAGVKERESFRPFAPAVLAEHAASWFVLDRPSPYMLVTAEVHPDRRLATADADRAPTASMAERLAAIRSEIPACTHVDGSARVQTVDAVTNPEFHRLLTAFHVETGCPVLLNTSFNRAGEPIVRSPADAHRCFVAAGLDLLVIEGCVIEATPAEVVGS